MYSLDAYLAMIADETRIGAYEEAIRRSVTPGAIVVDLGAGPGIMAMLACRHGAGHVYAIEPEPIAQVAREVIRANGLEAKVTVIEQRSTDVDLPERADVVVSDLRGILPLLADHIPSIIDTRTRHLKPGGVLIPARDRLFAAIVENESIHPRRLLDDVARASGFDFDSTAAMLTGTWAKAPIQADQLMTGASLIAEIDYATVSSPGISASVEQSVSRAGTAHGFALWFDTDLVDGVGFSNAPGEGELVYGRAFFPWPHGRDLAEGDVVRLTIEARLVKSDYLWNWRAELINDDGTTRQRFDQSNFGSSPVLASQLRRHAESYKPDPWRALELDLAILSLIDGTRSNGAIAEAVSEKAGGFEAALDRVAELVSRLAGGSQAFR